MAEMKKLLVSQLSFLSSPVLCFSWSRLKVSGTAGSLCSLRRMENDMSRSNCMIIPRMTPLRSARREARRASGQHLHVRAEIPSATWPWDSSWSLLLVGSANLFHSLSLLSKHFQTVESCN